MFINKTLCSLNHRTVWEAHHWVHLDIEIGYVKIKNNSITHGQDYDLLKQRNVIFLLHTHMWCCNFFKTNQYNKKDVSEKILG